MENRPFVLVKPKLNPSRRQTEMMYDAVLRSEPVEINGRTTNCILVSSQTHRKVLIKRGWTDVSATYYAQQEPPQPVKKKAKSRSKKSK